MARKQYLDRNTILLVDDDVTIINLLKDIIAGAGYNVIAAYNGVQALEKVQESNPDLIILDWNMPEMNGLTTLKELNKHSISDEIPVIMLTGVMTDPEHLREAFEYGVFDFIRKNFNSIELLSRIRAAIKFVKAKQQIIQLKNNELVENALKISKYNQFIESCLQQINDLFPLIEDTSEIWNKLLAFKSTVQSINVINHWSQFNEHFITINPDFYLKLSATHPKLGPAELKLCALLKLNLSTKEIADITCLSSKTIKTARSRLRKKLQLNSETSLSNYLLEF